jgi:hypothetical protein
MQSNQMKTRYKNVALRTRNGRRSEKTGGVAVGSEDAVAVDLDSGLRSASHLFPRASTLDQRSAEFVTRTRPLGRGRVDGSSSDEYRCRKRGSIRGYRWRESGRIGGGCGPYAREPLLIVTAGIRNDSRNSARIRRVHRHPQEGERAALPIHRIYPVDRYRTISQLVR